LKSAESRLENGFLETIEEKYIQCIQTCSLGPAERNVLTGDEIYCAVAPDLWTRLSSVADIKNRIKTRKSFSHKREMDLLGAVLHESLDDLSAPGRSLLNVVWVCDKVPENPSDALFSALYRAVSWHGGHLTVISSSKSTKYPDWIHDLRAEMLPVSYLSGCHGLGEYVSPSLVWRGNLSVLDPVHGNTNIQGYELHFQRDLLDLVLQKISLAKLETKENQTEKLRHFGLNLELMCSVDPCSVPASVLSRHHFNLVTPLLEDDGLSEYLFEAGFQGPRMGYIARLRVADSLDPKAVVRNKDNWGKRILDGTALEDNDDTFLGSNLDALHFLIYNDSSVANATSSRSVLQRPAVLLHSSEQLSSGLLTGSWRTAGFSNADTETVPTETGVKQFNVQSDIGLTALYAYKRNVCAKVLEYMLEQRHELVHSLETEDLVACVDAALSKVVSVLEESTSLNPEHRHCKGLVNTVHEDTAAKRVLTNGKQVETKDNKAEGESKPEKLWDPESRIVLEAKEIIRFFDSVTGAASPNLDLESIGSPGGGGTKQSSHKQYTRLFKQHYQPVQDEYKGFKYTGNDFQEFEQKRYKDVFYANGPEADQFDKDFKKKRDMFIGMSRETATTLDTDKVPAKLKVGGSTNNSTAGSRAGSVAGSRRSSPRKNIGKKTWHSPRKSAGSALARQNKLPPRGALQGGGARQNIRGQPDVGVKSAAEMRKKKLRVAVMTALLEKGIKENNPIFRKSFSTLFKLCEVMGIPQSGASGQKTSDMMLKVARTNVENVINIQVMNLKR